MRRRKLFTLAAGASAVLCIAVCVLWVRGYSTYDRLVIGSNNGGRYVFGSLRGRVFLIQLSGVWFYGETGLHSGSGGASDIWPERWGDQFPDNGAPGYALAGFEARGGSFQQPGTGRVPVPVERFSSITVPDWFLFALTIALLASAALRSAHMRHRTIEGLCPACGYDLRATPERCPECGAVPAATKGTA